MAIGVESGADRGDLAVHHPRRRDHVGARLGLRERDARVELDGGVVVDLSRRRQHAAVAMVGVLVETEVGHERELIAGLVTQIAQRHLHDPVGIPRLRTRRVLAPRYAEQHERGHAEVGKAARLLHQRLPRVLHDSRK